MSAADHARFRALGKRMGESRDLAGFLALIAGDRTGQRIEQEILGVLAGPCRKIVVSQSCREFCEDLRRFWLCCFLTHRDLPRTG